MAPQNIAANVIVNNGKDSIILDSVGVSLSVGIQRQVVHGTFELIAIDL